MELLKAFGVDYKILIAQLLNFAILFFVLYKLGYKPIFKFLDDRRDRIKDGLTMADKAEKKLSEAENEKKAIIIDSKKEAAAVISRADKLAKEKKDEIIGKAKEEIRTVLKAHNMDSCVNIEPIEIKEVIYNSDRKNDTGDIISFKCIDKEGHIINGKVQYHDNYSNKNAYVEIHF